MPALEPVAPAALEPVAPAPAALEPVAPAPAPAALEPVAPTGWSSFRASSGVKAMQTLGALAVIGTAYGVRSSHEKGDSSLTGYILSLPPIALLLTVVWSLIVPRLRSRFSPFSPPLPFSTTRLKLQLPSVVFYFPFVLPKQLAAIRDIGDGKELVNWIAAWWIFSLAMSLLGDFIITRLQHSQLIKLTNELNHQSPLHDKLSLIHLTMEKLPPLVGKKIPIHLNAAVTSLLAAVRRQPLISAEWHNLPGGGERPNDPAITPEKLYEMLAKLASEIDKLQNPSYWTRLAECLSRKQNPSAAPADDAESTSLQTPFWTRLAGYLSREQNPSAAPADGAESTSLHAPLIGDQEAPHAAAPP